MPNIRIGETFTTSYTFYNPLSGNNKLPDYTSPIDWTGYTAKFCIVNNRKTTKYSTTLETIAGHTELCKVSVSLTATETAALKKTETRDITYIEFTSGSTVITRARQSAEILKQEDR